MLISASSGCKLKLNIYNRLIIDNIDVKYIIKRRFLKKKTTEINIKVYIDFFFLNKDFSHEILIDFYPIDQVLYREDTFLYIDFSEEKQPYLGE